MNLANVKAVVKYEGHLLCSWILMRHWYPLKNGMLLCSLRFYVCPCQTGYAWWPHSASMGEEVSPLGGAWCGVVCSLALSSARWIALPVEMLVLSLLFYSPDTLPGFMD